MQSGHGGGGSRRRLRTCCSVSFNSPVHSSRAMSSLPSHSAAMLVAQVVFAVRDGTPGAIGGYARPQASLSVRWPLARLFRSDVSYLGSWSVSPWSRSSSIEYTRAAEAGPPDTQFSLDDLSEWRIREGSSLRRMASARVRSS